MQTSKRTVHSHAGRGGTHPYRIVKYAPAIANWTKLKKMWEPAAEGKIITWKEVRVSWPDNALKLYSQFNLSLNELLRKQAKF